MKSLFGGLLFVGASFFCLGGGVVHAGPTEGDVYTAKEKKALERFKPLVIPKIPASSHIQNYKNDDLFWVQWLRFKNLDVRGAERLFLEHLKWREEMKMDSIFDEDWSEYERDIPVFSDGFTKDGRPFSELWAGLWQVRSKVVAGKMKTLQRYAASLYEKLRRRLFEARAVGNNNEKNVSQIVAIAELGDFNLIEVGCPTCLPLFASMAVNIEHHYPNLLENVFLINIPPSFDIILKVITPILRPVMRRAIKSYPEKAGWSPVLDGLIDKSQRSVSFGGTKVRDV